MAKDSKPTIINDIIDNKSYGFAFKENIYNSLQILENKYSYPYMKLIPNNTSNIIKELNNSRQISKVFGCGCMFELKDKGQIYTYMNNAYGCAGTGIQDETEDNNDSWAKKIYNYFSLKPVSNLVSSEIWQIHDLYSYDPVGGLKTYYIAADRKTVYMSGKLNDEIMYQPSPIIYIEDSTIKECYDMEYGGFLYLLNDGRLYYWGDNDKNYIYSTQDISHTNSILLGEGIDHIYTMANICIYKKDGKYYAMGYPHNDYSKHPLSIDVELNMKYPYPGVPLNHLPFSTPDKIKQIMTMKHGVAVLLDNGYLYITGRDQQFNIADEKCKLEATNVEEISFTNGYIVGYKKLNDIYYHISDGTIMKDYIFRHHRYHPSIALL